MPTRFVRPSLRRCAILLVALAAIATPRATRAEPALLTPDGLSPVRLGMRIAQAEKSLKARLGRLSRSSDGFATEPESSEPCWYWRRRDNRDAGIIYMTERGVITRIDVSRPRGGAAPAIATRRGITIGRSAAELAAKHSGIALAPHPLAPHVSWAVVEKTGRAGLRVEVSGGVVTSLFAARSRALDYPEGCS